jgi:hypothetical protein
MRYALAGAVALCLLALAVPAHADGWGTVKGKIVFNGAPPPRAPIDVTTNRKECEEKGKLFSEELIVNPKNKGVKNVIVWLLDNSGKYDTPLPIHPSLKEVKGDLEIDQPCCQYLPHISAIREGQGIVFKNSATISHGIHVYGGLKGPEFNVTLPAGAEKPVPAKDLPARATPILLKCDIHPWMTGYVRVFPHPYFAITDEDGNFTIKNAPAGNYRIAIWTETGWVKGDKTGTPITIKAGGDTDLGAIHMSPPKKETD